MLGRIGSKVSNTVVGNKVGHEVVVAGLSQVLAKLILRLHVDRGLNEAMRRASKQIWQLLDTTISAMGYEFVGAEFGQAENGMTLRVYIDLLGENRQQSEDAKKTVLVDDCADVSRQVGAVLDVEDPIQGEYVLEVSSPGLNRPLFSASQFEAQVGETVKLKLKKPVELEGSQRRNFKGTLVNVGVEAGEIELSADGQSHRLRIDDVEQARLVYAF